MKGSQQAKQPSHFSDFVNIVLKGVMLCAGPDVCQTSIYRILCGRFLSPDRAAARGDAVIGHKTHVKRLSSVTLLRASAAAQPRQCVMSDRLHILRR